MSNYVKATNFATKDTLPTGDANKIVKGTEIDNEFVAIAGAVSSKSDTASPAFTGTPAAPTATAGSNTTQIANTAYVKTAVDTAVAGLGTMSTQNANAVNITGGTITGITDLAVADGGTGRSALTNKSLVVGAGTSPVNFVAPSTLNNVLKSDGTDWVSGINPAIGVGQTWQNFTVSGRAQNTVYTNSTGLPIQVVILCSAVNDVGFRVNSNLVVGQGINQNAPLCVIVPNGQTYELRVITSATIASWWELR